jgi:predicted secreted protein
MYPSRQQCDLLKEGIMSATTASIPLPTPQQPHSQASAALAIIRHVIDDIIGTIFTSSAGGTNVSPQRSFPSAQSPGATTTTVTLKPGISSIAYYCNKQMLLLLITTNVAVVISLPARIIKIRYVNHFTPKRVRL